MNKIPLTPVRPSLAPLLIICIVFWGVLTLWHGTSRAQRYSEFEGANGKFVRDPALPIWATPLLEIPKATPNGPMQSLYSETQFNAGARHDYLTVRAFQLNHQSALREIGQFPIEFIPDYETIKLHSLKIIRNGQTIDKTRTVDVRFSQREIGLENGVYSGTVTASIVSDDLRVGDIFFIVYSKQGANPVFGDTYSTSAAWDSSVFTSLRRVVLVHTPAKNIAWKLHGSSTGKPLVPTKSEVRGNTVVTFEERDLEAIIVESDVPSDFIANRYLQFSEYKNWQQVAAWGVGLFNPKVELPPELNRLVSRWNDLSTKQAKVAAALRWVQDEIRYFSLSVGDSSHRPYPPLEVVKRRYGDCKDKTYLLLSILNKLGIESYPVLVLQSGFKSVRHAMPSPLLFDHVVVLVILDGKQYYLDGTRLGQRGSLDTMGWAMPAADALVLSSNTTTLSTIEVQNKSQKGSTLSEVFSLENLSGEASLKTLQSFYELEAESWRVANKQYTEEQKRQALMRDYEKRYPGIRMVGVPIFRDEEGTNQLHIEVNYRIPNLMRQEQGEWFFRFFPNNLIDSVSLPQNLSRKTPAVFASYPKSLNYSLMVSLPDSVNAMLDAATQKLNNEFFKAEMTRTFRGNTSTATFNFQSTTNEAAPQKLILLQEEIRKLERIAGGVVIVEKGFVKEAVK
jgi:transglutaminase-like putative cysteine protease